MGEASNLDLMKQLTSEQIAAFIGRVENVKENESMSAHTAFRIGGAARLFVTVASADEFVSAVKAAREFSIPFFVMGGGTNLLVSDDGFDGVIIQANMKDVAIDGERVMADAGAIAALIAKQTADAGLEGFAWAAGLPGTIGGAVYGNSGCFGGKMQDAVERVNAFRLRDSARITLANADCAFAYRESIFKHEPHIILSATLRLAPALDAEANHQRLEEVMRLRREKQPQGAFSCGCVFKNYEFHDEKDLAILRREMSEIPESMLRAKTLGAGWLIDQAGMKGQRIGGMEVSDVHGNFFLNRGGGTASDVIMLISMVKRKVRDDLGIELQEEVQYVGM